MHDVLEQKAQRKREIEDNLKEIMHIDKEISTSYQPALVRRFPNARKATSGQDPGVRTPPRD
jgi:hypothetical protein